MRVEWSSWRLEMVVLRWSEMYDRSFPLSSLFLDQTTEGFLGRESRWEVIYSISNETVIAVGMNVVAHPPVKDCPTTRKRYINK